MFEVSVTCEFKTKTKKQAEYIAQFFQDAQSLMTCETSGFGSTGVSEVEEVTPREEFEKIFGPISADQWQRLKEFVRRHPVT